MNKFILTVQGYLLYPENYTNEQLEQNYIDAVNAADAAWASAYSAAYCAAYSSAYYGAYYGAANPDANFAAVNAADAAHNGDSYTVEYWLNEYFEITDENRQDYIDAINGGEL